MRNVYRARVLIEVDLVANSAAAANHEAENELDNLIDAHLVSGGWSSVVKFETCRAINRAIKVGERRVVKVKENGGSDG